MKNNNKFFTVLKERWQIYLLIGPFLILFVLMTVLPLSLIHIYYSALRFYASNI